MYSCDSSPAKGASHSGTILLVDDEQPLLDIYATILGPYFDIVKAINAKDADILIRQNNIKVIVADHLMPGETGLSFLARVRQVLPHIQRVLVTGNMTDEMKRQAAESNLLFAYLVKPISITEMINVVQAAAQVHDSIVAATK
jgi:two-component system, NtrC family, response regulator HupR/HoxA